MQKFYKVAIYIRVSTREQAESGYSIGEQQSRLEKYCDAMGWTVYRVFVDPGYSGAKMDRPALNELLNDVKDGKIDAVLVWKLDRLSRSQKDTLFLIEDQFLKNDVAFISTLENFDTSTPFGRAMIGILSVFAQLEREQITERMQLGLDARAKDGKWHGGGFDPYGYDYINGELVINENEAAGVRKVYELFTEKRWSVHKIQLYMQDRFVRKYGVKQFKNDSAILKILTNNIYTGRVSWKGQSYIGQHEPIITDEQFNLAQKLYNDRKWQPRDGRSNPFDPFYLLSGLIYCGNCGARYFVKGNYSGRGENRRYYPYYTCYSRGKTKNKYIIDPTCKNPSFACEKLDRLILEQIKALSLDPAAVMLLIEKSKNENNKDQNLIDNLEKQITAGNEQIKRLIELCKIGGALPVQNIAAEIETVQNQIDKYKKQIESIREDQAGADLDLSYIKDQFMSAAGIIENGDKADLRQLVKTLIYKIEIQPDASIKIFWSFDAPNA